MKKIFISILFAGYFFTQPMLQAQNIGWLEGTWSGEADQPNAMHQTKWSTTITYDPATGILKVDYPSLQCGAEWVLVSADSTKATFTENLTYGLDKCLNGGKVIVYRLDNNYRSIHYFDPENPNLEIAKGFVKKQ